MRLLPIVVALAACGDDAGTNPVDVALDSAVETAAEADAVAGTHADAVADADADAVVEGWRWESLPSLPEAIQENAVVWDGTDLWVIGGFQGFEVVAKTFRYRVSEGAWSAGPALPEAVHHANGAYAGDKLWVLGALQGIGFTATGKSWVFDASNDEGWVPSTVMHADRQRGASAVAVVGDDVFVMGGLRLGDAVKDVDVFHTADASWEPLPDLPAARDHVVAAAIGGKVYVAGGRDGGITNIGSEVWLFGDDGWTVETVMPTPRGGASVAVVNGLMVILGGEGNEGAASGVFPQAEAYDPTTKLWITLPAMLTPRHGTGAAGFDGAAWMPGGANVQAFGAVDTFERLVAP